MRKYYEENITLEGRQPQAQFHPPIAGPAAGMLYHFALIENNHGRRDINLPLG